MNTSKRKSPRRTSAVLTSKHTGVKDVIAQKRYFIGQDLHCNNVHVSVVVSVLADDGKIVGKVMKSRKISLEKGPGDYIKFLEEFCENTDFSHIAVVESTYNWYWMADLFEKRGWNLLLADPATVSRDKTKACNDKTDAEFLAESLRNGSCHTACIMPRQERSERDLVRLRTEIIQERAAYMTKLRNLFTSLFCSQELSKKLHEFADSLREGDVTFLSELPVLSGTKHKIEYWLNCYNKQTDELERIELLIESEVQSFNKTAAALQTIKGCGPALSRVAACEIGDVTRFKTASNFVSYCRLAPTSKLSNNKSKGMGNAKNGNAHLSWCFTEIANYVVRYNPSAKKEYDRLFKKSGLRVKAIRAIAAKVARGSWYCFAKGQTFDMERCFAR